MTNSPKIPVKVPLPQPGVEPVWGVLRTLQEARKNVLRIIPTIALTQPIVSGKIFWARWHMVMDPDTIGQILKEKLADYPKSDVTKNLLEPAIGDSLFIAEGAHWRWQRRTAAPVFSHRNIAALAPIMSAAAQTSSKRLAATNGEADLFDEMVRTTFDVIASVTFSGGDRFEPSLVHKAIDAYIDQIARVSLLDIIGVPTWVPRPGQLFRPNVLGRVKKLADAAIKDRAQTPHERVPDLLDLLLAGQDPETKRKMNTAELRDNLLTFIVAGHETTALTLSWAFYLLANDPEAQNRVRQEAQAVLKGRAATAEDVPKLAFTQAVLNETLRLYPPAAIISRTAQRQDRLCDREIQKGDSVIIPIYALHRHHDLWDNPDAFDPDRFLRAKPERYAFLPFGDGPRVCIGAQFAMMEATIVLATLISRFAFDPVNGQTPKPVMVLTLRPEGGVKLKIRPL